MHIWLYLIRNIENCYLQVTKASRIIYIWIYQTITFQCPFLLTYLGWLSTDNTIHSFILTFKELRIYKHRFNPSKIPLIALISCFYYLKVCSVPQINKLNSVNFLIFHYLVHIVKFSISFCWPCFLNSVERSLLF